MTGFFDLVGGVISMGRLLVIIVGAVCGFLLVIGLSQIVFSPYSSWGRFVNGLAAEFERLWSGNLVLTSLTGLAACSIAWFVLSTLQAAFRQPLMPWQ